MDEATAEIQAMVDRETRAWDDQDAEALVALFHPDMVWPWPPDEHAHDPGAWVFPLGKFDRDRYKSPERAEKWPRVNSFSPLQMYIHSQPIFLSGIMPIIFGPRLVCPVRTLQAWEGEREQYNPYLKVISSAALTAVFF